MAALGSYLDARAQGGQWRVRIEDLDSLRAPPGAAERILRTLEALGLHWDGPVSYQSRRSAAYAAAIKRLRDAGLVYPCGCSRSEIADSSIQGVEGPIYPGTCRAGLPPGKAARSLRLRVSDQPLSFEDRLQGRYSQNLAVDTGDFVLQRADGPYAYQLAVVVDDAEEGITHVVRGADLLVSTPRQIYLQRLLGLPTPMYLHLPLAVDAQGAKLSKQNGADGIETAAPAAVLYAALDFLAQSPPPELRRANAQSLLDWAVQNWQPQRLRGRKTCVVRHDVYNTSY